MERANTASADDPFNLARFVQAQEDSYKRALSEIRGGRKQSHWMWYVFPQFAGLAISPTSQRYAVNSVAEAEETYFAHPVLGAAIIGVRGSCSSFRRCLSGRHIRRPR